MNLRRFASRFRCFVLGHRFGVWANPERRCIDCGRRLR